MTDSFEYEGKAYNKPCGRGLILSDIKEEPCLSDVLDTGEYEVKISIVKRLCLCGGGGEPFSGMRCRNCGGETL